MDRPWQVAFQPGRGTPAAMTLPALTSLSDQSAPGVTYFSGVASYRRTFDAPRGYHADTPLRFDLGTVADIAEVRINGAMVGIAWHAPYRLDIGKAAKRGRNRPDIRVANARVNRLIGDKQPDATRITFATRDPHSRHGEVICAALTDG